jgi:hypothetical protein
MLGLSLKRILPIFGHNQHFGLCLHGCHFLACQCSFAQSSSFFLPTLTNYLASQTLPYILASQISG